MPYLICYDIEDDKRRKKISNKLVAIGLERVQYSVFIGPLKAHLLRDLKTYVSQLINTSEPMRDSIIIMNLIPQQIEKMTILGNNTLNKKSLAGTQNTLFL